MNSIKDIIDKRKSLDVDDEIRDILREREALHPEDYISIEECWKKEIEILSRDVDATIDFIANRCTAEEFVWLSEVFEEVQWNTKSDALRECLYATAEKYPEETKEYNILEFIINPEEGQE